MLPWHSFDTNNKAVFSPHWMSRVSSWSIPALARRPLFNATVSFKLSLEVRTKDSGLFNVFPTLFLLPSTVTPLVARNLLSPFSRPAPSTPVSKHLPPSKVIAMAAGYSPRFVAILARVATNGCPASPLTSLISLSLASFPPDANFVTNKNTRRLPAEQAATRSSSRVSIFMIVFLPPLAVRAT